jgi:signal transduction histidine kinase
MSGTPDAGADGARGILAGVSRLGTALHVCFVVLILASVARYLENHGFDSRAGWVIAGAGVSLLLYLAYGRVPWRRSRAWPSVWCAALVLTWMALVAAAPSFAWCAVPLAFAALRLLPFPVAVTVVAVMVVTVSVAWSQMQERVDPTVFAGPACVALLAVTAYRALEREAQVRQRLLEDLHDAQGDLADAQQRAGASAERARLSRDIHDSVAQHLSSINLLLLAAEQDWDARHTAARQHVRRAAATARDGLEEVRRVVRDLAPPKLGDAVALPTALRAASSRAVQHSDLVLDVAVHGEVAPLPDEVATALLQTARGALANVVEHAHASHAAVTLTYQEGSVSLDVRDDGRGFDVAVGTGHHDDRGFGLSGIRARAAALGGEMVVESTPGDGTALAVSLPLRVPSVSG